MTAQLGRMLKETPKNTGVRMAGKDIGGTKWEPPIDVPTLAEMGLDKKTKAARVMTVRIYEHADIKPLALAVVSQAIRDLREGDTMTALDAALWLTSDDFDIWADVMGIPLANGYKLLTGGNARRMRTGRK